MTKTATLRATTVAKDDDAAPSIGATPSWTGALDFNLSLTEGTGANQYDLAYLAERTVATGANDDIDLAGVLTDVFGNVITAAEIVSIQIINKPSGSGVNTTDLTIGNGGVNSFIGMFGAATHTVGPFKPGSMFMAAAGDAAGLGAVVAGTGDILRVANSAGASATYQIAILARSA